MDLIPMLFAQVMVVVVLGTAAIAAIALGTRVLWRLTSRVKPRDLPTVTPSDFQRLETAIEAIAVEVERISESQRFTVTLLNERGLARDGERRGVLGAPVPLTRVNTPH